MEFYQVIQPSPLLAPYVKHYWFLQTSNSAEAAQRILPTGLVSLIFHRAKPLYAIPQKRTQPQAFLGGQADGYLDLLQTGKVDMIAVVFHPYGAKAFFNLPINELKGLSVSLSSLGDPLLGDLEKRILDTPDNSRCVKLIEDFLLKRLVVPKQYNFKRIGEAIKAINHGGFDAAQLAGKACLSYKQFKRIFAEYVGANPKEFSRVVRFQKALYILQSNPHVSLAQLAFDCGYYDQPHLVKEFKQLSGHTPLAYTATCAPYSDYFS